MITYHLPTLKEKLLGNAQELIIQVLITSSEHKNWNAAGFFSDTQFYLDFNSLQLPNGRPTA